MNRDQIVAEDITSATLVRKSAMLSFLPEYTTQVDIMLSVIKEIDIFHQAMEAALFDTFVCIQKERLNKFNVALQQSEELYKQAQALTHIGNWTWFIQTNQIIWSDEMFRIYGIEPQSEQISFDRFISLIHPDDRQGRMEQINTALQTLNCPDYTMRIIRPDGRQVMLEGKSEILVKNGNPYSMTGTCRDITTEYHLRQELLAEKLRLAEANALLEQKNADLERSNKELTSFTYVASHDLQEPLRKIMMFSQMLLDKESKGMTDRGKELFTKIHAGAQSMKRLIEDLLSYSRVQSYTEVFAPVDLNVILQDVKRSFVDLSPGKITIISDELPSINGISFQLYQLFENIIGNAIKYAKPNEAPHITITCRLVAGSDFLAGNLNSDIKYYKIDFIDNGIGFENEYSEKIFEIFQRLHKRGEYTGTGIGLAICKKIVQNHAGAIAATSSLGQGADFTIYLPQ
ncbi:MAG TPA: ATP-binding protein [Chitinophagales bacterium]|nr:ATP-binding protein [Chitinophagales bacterium]